MCVYLPMSIYLHISLSIYAYLSISTYPYRIYEGLKSSEMPARINAINMLGFIARKGYMLIFSVQGADFKNNKTTKQESHQEYYCFLVVQFYLDQQKGRKKYFTYYLLVEMKLYIKKTIIYLMRFLFRCFIVFLNPLPGVWAGVEAGLCFISYLQLLINHNLSSPLKGLCAKFR